MIKHIDDNEYDIVCGWWKHHGFEPVARIMLPKLPDGGFIAYDDKTPIIACFLYVSDAAIGWVEWIVSKPGSTKDQRDVCFGELMDGVFVEAKKRGLLMLHTESKNPSLTEKLIKKGFLKADTEVTVLDIPLGE